MTQHQRIRPKTLRLTIRPKGPTQPWCTQRGQDMLGRYRAQQRAGAGRTASPVLDAGRRGSNGSRHHERGAADRRFGEAPVAAVIVISQKLRRAYFAAMRAGFTDEHALVIEDGDEVLVGLTVEETAEYLDYLILRHRLKQRPPDCPIRRDRWLQLYEKHERARAAVLRAEFEKERLQPQMQ